MVFDFSFDDVFLATHSICIISSGGLQLKAYSGGKNVVEESFPLTFIADEAVEDKRRLVTLSEFFFLKVRALKLLFSVFEFDDATLADRICGRRVIEELLSLSSLLLLEESCFCFSFCC